jgi:hypothetical protein
MTADQIMANAEHEANEYNRRFYNNNSAKTVEPSSVEIVSVVLEEDDWFIDEGDDYIPNEEDMLAHRLAMEKLNEEDDEELIF